MKIYYVYQLRLEDQEHPFYVGKGQGDRAYYHFSVSSINSGENRHKTNTIMKAQREGKVIHVEFVKKGLTEQEAYDLERDLVQKYGRRNNGTGVLTNLTDGGYGPLGYRHTQETKDKLSDIVKTQFLTNEKYRNNVLRRMDYMREIMWNGPDREKHQARASKQMKERLANGYAEYMLEGVKRWYQTKPEEVKARNAKIAEKMNSEENRRKTSERVKELFKNEEYRKAVFPPLHISPRYLKKNAEDYQARLSVCICMGKLYDFWVENGKRTFSYYENPNSIGFNYDNKLLINPIKNFQKGYNPNECEEYQEWIKDKELDALWSDLGVYNKRGPEWKK